MSKYYLVASHYNIYTKNYEKEVIIKEINGINLSSLNKIDEITSKYDNFELLKIIREKLNNNMINHIAIKYIKSSNETPIYYRVISNDNMYHECVTNLGEPKKITILDKTRNTLFVNKNNKLFKRELNKLLEIIKNGDFGMFKSIYDKENDFTFLVRRYFNSLYDSELDKEKDLELILLEFSRYKTFRGWYIETTKKQKNNIKRNNISQKKDNSLFKRRKNLSYEESMKLYEQEFESKNNMTYDKYKTLEHNRGDNYFSDKEEFLDEEEFGMMSGYSNDNFDKLPTSKIFKRGNKK